MNYIALIAMAAIAAVAVWRVLSLSKSLAAVTAENTALKLDLEKARNTDAVELATTRQALESLRAAKAETEEAYARRVDQLAAELQQRLESLTTLREENARLATSLAHFEEERENREQQMTAQFKNLANDILRQNSADFKAQNEQRLEELLSPLRTNLDEFRKTVTETYSSEARERFSLTERIRELVELNNTISREARELTLALRGNNQVQGDWGEMVLETILEKSGLQEGEEYFMQVTNDQCGSALRNEAGRKLRPDVVVKYPDGRCVIIDSKVSLTAFIEYANAENEKIKDEASARHLKSMRAHIDELARKNYQDYIGEAKLDFVMMFIPNEPAYIAAMRLDPSLWQEAYDRKVLIVSPTHLVSGLRLIEQLWSRDKVTKNAIKIAEDAGKMYDKFADFTKDMDRISSAIANASKAHADAMTKLSTGTGNLVKRAQDLKALGIKAAKQLSASVEQG
ncbi:DNA recombination protein RmuC [Duncaniella muricolitica]|uniref:DNA recombination protein RmuC n=1 Tax=Duncaniella muricolitica TaxID=2880704 RepID=UPI00244DF4E7|nr:DNA recombination protein RmuC [Duncaniella muricolitica]